jgi:hypothetical protein
MLVACLIGLSLLMIMAQETLCQPQKPSLVLVNLAKVPTYLHYALDQVFIFNPHIDVTILHAMNHYQQQELMNVSSTFFRKGHTIEVFDAKIVEAVLTSEHLGVSCLLCQQIAKVLVDIHGRNEYYISTTKRYLALYYYFLANPTKQHVFHIESDIMVYGNFERLSKALMSCEADLAYPSNLGSLVYFKDIKAVEYMLRNFLVHLNRMLKLKLENKMKLQDINDMVLLKMLKHDHQQSANQTFKLLELPDNPHLAPNHCVFQKDPSMLYDPHRFGQLLGGTPRLPLQAFINPVGPFRPNVSDMSWVKDGSGRFVVKYHNLTVFNLHIHCKLLEEFLSTRDVIHMPKPLSV